MIRLSLTKALHCILAKLNYDIKHSTGTIFIVWKVKTSTKWFRFPHRNIENKNEKYQTCRDFKIAGMEVADGGFGLTRGEHLISISCSSESGSLLIGSTPFSATNFSISLLSYTWPETGDTTGFSGTSLEIAQINDVILSLLTYLSIIKLSNLWKC